MPSMKRSKKGHFLVLLLNIAIAAVLLVIIGYLVLRGLDRYTRHGFSIQVPNLTGLTLEEADSVAAIYSSSDRPGAVVEQFPLPRARVKNSRVIQLTTNALNPEQISFPELRNLAFRQAIQQLNSIGLDVRHIQFAPSPFRNLVLDYKLGDSLLQPGNLVAKGQAIDLILGAGENGDQVYLPRLIGLTVSEARRQTLLAYLNIGEVIPDATVTSRTDLASARVYEQLPRYINKRTLAQGDTLVLRVTLDEQKIQLADSLLNAQHQ